MSGPDIRGFSYALEPVRRRRKWKLDAALTHLGNLIRRLADKRAVADTLREQCAAQALQASRSWIARSDPVAKTRVLQYLAALHARTVQTERDISALSLELRVAREECASRQQALEVIDTHRAEMLKSFATDKARKFSAHADADWLARGSHRSMGENSQ